MKLCEVCNSQIFEENQETKQCPTCERMRCQTCDMGSGTVCDDCNAICTAIASIVEEEG